MLKAAFVGAGHRAQDAHYPTVNRLADVRIEAVAELDEPRMATVVDGYNIPLSFTDYHKMLDEAKPYAVSICPRWIDQHRDMVVAAAQRGVHIYMEKPMCRTLEEAVERLGHLRAHLGRGRDDSTTR